MRLRNLMLRSAFLFSALHRSVLEHNMSWMLVLAMLYAFYIFSVFQQPGLLGLPLIAYF